MTNKPISEVITTVEERMSQNYKVQTFNAYKFEVAQLIDHIKSLENHCKELREMFDDAENARIETAAELIDANARLAAYDRAEK